MSSKLKFAVSTLVSVVLAVVLYLLVLAVSHNNNYKWDLTENQRFSLSEQSRKVVRELQAPVEALVFLQETDQAGRRKAEDLLGNYRRVDPARFRYEIVDLKKSPGLAREHDVRMPGTVVLVAGKKTERVPTIDEEALTNALLKLAEIQKRKVYFLVGHGERSGEDTQPTGLSNFRAALAKEGYEAADLNLARDNRIPEDAAAVFLMGPTRGLLPAEQETVGKWLAAGGHVLLMVDLDTGNSFDWLLDRYGFRVPEEVVVDRASQLFGAQPVYPVGLSYDKESPITKPFLTEQGIMNTIFGVSRPVNVAEKVPEGATVRPVVQTGPEAATIPAAALSGKSDLARVTASQTGTIPLVTSGTYPPPGQAPSKEPGAEAGSKSQIRVLVAGNVDFVSNGMLELYGNRDLAMNMVNWITETEARITLRPKDTAAQPLVLTQTQASQMWLLLVAAIPGAILLAGFLTAFRRR